MNKQNIEGQFSGRVVDRSYLGPLAQKREQRNPYSFCNINLLGKCNVDCYFCLGHDLETEFAKYNNLQTHYTHWDNWDGFLSKLTQSGVPQVYITGQNTDALLYKYLDELIYDLKSRGVAVGIRTNGLLAIKRMDTINACTTVWGDAVSYSIHTLDLATQRRIWKTPIVPDWSRILSKTTVPYRVAFVVNRHNWHELDRVANFVAESGAKYMQVRKICTDTRYPELEEDMVLFERLRESWRDRYSLKHMFETSEVFDYHGLEVSFWSTVGTTVNSFNYFSNGVLSDEYYIIEGYAMQKGLNVGGREYLASDRIYR